MSRPDLWSVCREEDVAMLDFLVGPDGGNGVNDLDDYGRTPLHVAVAHGSENAVRYLIAAGANVHAVDRESQWSPLHRALYLGHLKIALLLLRAGAVLGDEVAPWTKGRQTEPVALLDADGHSPISLLSLLLKDSLRCGPKAVGGEVFSFGKADFPLGYVLPNTADVHKPRRVETLTHLNVVAVAAARHQSVALTREGHVYTWGHGKGGRLGHGDEKVRMFPERVEALRNIPVAKVSASENHTAVITTQGVVFTWGSDSFGQLGLGGGSTGEKASCTRLVPRRVEALRRMVIVDISAGPTHTAAVTSSGEVYTWGGNKAGQLGYEPLGAVGDGIPRLVTLLYHRHGGKEPRRAIQVSAGSRCTLVIVKPDASPSANTLSVNKVYQFGYGSCVPIRVDFRPAESSQAHKSFWGIGCRDSTAGRINIRQVAAALHHNVALSYAGRVYTWGLGRDQLGLEEGQVSCPVLVSGISSSSRGLDHAVYVSASAEHTCVVTDLGDMYSWGTTDDQGILGHGPGRWQPVPKRVKGLKRVTQVAAGPEHTIVLLSPYCPPLPYAGGLGTSTRFNSLAIRSTEQDEMFLMDEDDATPPVMHQPQPPVTDQGPESSGVLSLKQICERVIASHTDMKNAVSVLAHAEVLDSPCLASYALDFLMQNLDGILVLGRPADLDFLLEDQADGINRMILERQQQQQVVSSAPLVEEDMDILGTSPSLKGGLTSNASTLIGKISKGREPTLEEAVKWERSLKKRMAQIEDLERAKAQGVTLTEDQVAKVSRKENVRKELATLEPVLRRLRFVHSARLARGDAVPAVEVKKEESLEVELVELAEGQELEEAVMVVEKKVFETRVCAICNVTCTSEEGWEEHMMGKRHKKRLASVAAAAKADPSPSASDPAQDDGSLGEPAAVKSPWFSKGKSPQALEPPGEAPQLEKTGSSPGQARTTPAKSFREILEEEEQQAARTQYQEASVYKPGNPRASSGPSPRKATPDFPSFTLQPLGRSPKVATSPGLSLPLTPQSTPTTAQILRSTPPSPSPALLGSGGVLLSDFLNARKTPTKKVAASKASVTTPTAPWAKKTPEKAVEQVGDTMDKEVVRPPEVSGCSPAQMKDIMREEEDKVLQNRRFSGNNSVWFVEPRQRTNSFDIIQTEQELEAIKAEFDRLEREKLAEERKEEEKRKELEKKRKARAKVKAATPEKKDKIKDAEEQGGKKRSGRAPAKEKQASTGKQADGGRRSMDDGTSMVDPNAREGGGGRGQKDKRRPKPTKAGRTTPEGAALSKSQRGEKDKVGKEKEKEKRARKPKSTAMYIPKASGATTNVAMAPVEGGQHQQDDVVR